MPDWNDQMPLDYRGKEIVSVQSKHKMFRIVNRRCHTEANVILNGVKNLPF